jgi:hypothetical protein
MLIGAHLSNLHGNAYPDALVRQVKEKLAPKDLFPIRLRSQLLQTHNHLPASA